MANPVSFSECLRPVPRPDDPVDFGKALRQYEKCNVALEKARLAKVVPVLDEDEGLQFVQWSKAWSMFLAARAIDPKQKSEWVEWVERWSALEAREIDKKAATSQRH
jgi:hypothetical protein